ncbi:MAG: tetratricopeptide repeat protein [Paracoccaceae bacterium]
MNLCKLALIGFLAAAPMGVSAKGVTLNEETSLDYSGDVESWLLNRQIMDLSGASQDPDALAAVAQLFRQGHPRASVGLKNYFDRFPNDPSAFDLAGIELLREQKYKQAKVSFQRAIQLGASNPWTRAKLGMTELLLGNMDRGTEMLEGVINEDPANPLARRYLAWSAAQSGNLPRAIQHSEAALQAFGLPKATVNRAHLDLAGMYRRAARFHDIQSLLNLAVQNSDLKLPDQTLIELYGMYLDASLEIKDVNGANVALTRLRRLGLDKSPQYRLASARVDLIEDNAEAAIEKIQALRNDVPALELELIPDLARAEASAGRVSQAVSRLKSLATVRGAGRDVPVLREAAALLNAKGTPEMMLAFVDDTLLAADDRVDLQRLGIELLIRGNEHDRARDEAHKLVAAAPQDAFAQRLLGNLLMDNASKDEAIAAFRKSIELYPEDPEAWLTLLGAVHGHETYSHAGPESGHGEVEQLLKDAIAANPNSAKLYTELGLLYLSDGNLEPAIGSFSDALTRSPGYLPALSLAALSQADLGKNLGSARELASLARQLAPTDSIAQDIEGWIAYKAGNLDKAAELLDAALALDENDTTTLYHRAVVSEKQGAYDAARDMYVRSLAGGDTYRHYQEDARGGLIRIQPSQMVMASVHRLEADGAGELLGQLHLTPLSADGGVRLSADISGLPEGPNAAHIHEYPTCAPKDGKIGGASGPHFGHAHVHAAAADGSSDTTPVDHAAMGHEMPKAEEVVDHAAMGHEMPKADEAVDHAAMGHEMPKAEEVVDHAAMGHDVPKAEEAVDHAAMGHDVPKAEEAVDHSAILPRGDLAPFIFDASLVSTTTVDAPQLNLDEIRGRVLMIHLGADVDGKSGAKIACAIIH